MTDKNLLKDLHNLSDFSHAGDMVLYHLFVCLCIFFCFVNKMGFTPCKDKQSLQGKESQEKEAQKD